MSNIELANAILQYATTQPFIHLLDLTDEFSFKQGYKPEHVKVTVAELLENKYLVLMQNRQRSVMITEMGKEAAKIGIAEYKEYELKDYKNDKKASKREALKIAIISSIIGAIIGAIITKLLS